MEPDNDNDKKRKREEAESIGAAAANPDVLDESATKRQKTSEVVTSELIVAVANAEPNPVDVPLPNEEVKTGKIRPTQWHPLPRYDKFVDEIRIKHAIRFKDSPVSGSEWRTNLDIDLMYKGEVVYQKQAGSNIGEALPMASVAMEKYWKYDYTKIDKLNDIKCMQPGCSTDATTFYRMKNDRCTHCNKNNEKYPEWGYKYRKFCDAHAHRGLGYYDDSDDNYERIDRDGNVMENPPPVPKPDASIRSVPATVIMGDCDSDDSDDF